MTWKQWFLMGAAVVTGSAWAATPSVVVVEPLCKATEAWNQTGALNANIHMGKGYPCGCDPLAWGQVLTYHALEHGVPSKSWKPTPVKGVVGLFETLNFAEQGTYVERTTSSDPYNWENVRDQGADVSRLMYDLGVLGNAAYRPNLTSGTLKGDVIKEYFGYEGQGWRYTSPYYPSYSGNEPNWKGFIGQQVRASLHAGAPLVVSIQTSAGGHMVICDGYGYDANGALLFHFHYGWGKGYDYWYPESWWWGEGGNDRLQTVEMNVHPEALGCVLAGRVTRAGKAVANAVVTLSNAARTTTDAKGAYCFTGLAMQTNYTVTLTVGDERFVKTAKTGEFVDDELRGKRQDEQDKLYGKGQHVQLNAGNVMVDFELPQPAMYVTPNGTGDGSSWEKAAALTNATLQSAVSGQTICVASGNYTVKEFITVPAGVTLMGGYNPTTGVRNVYGSPSIITMGTGAYGYPPSYIFQIDPTAIVDGFVLENSQGWSNSTIDGGTVKNCIFTGSYAKIAENATLQCCIVRNLSATQEECSLIHCTFAGEIPTGKENKGIVAGCLAKAATDFPAATLIGTCTCNQCPETALNGRALDKTPGALATPAPGFTLNVR